MPKHFYIFRHGQCPLNITNHIQGQKFNGELTIEGKKQAAQTAEKLKDKQITLIISSPMKRAIQTAKIIAEKIHTPILVDHRFIEVNMGIAEGLHISIVEKKYSKLYQKWRYYPNSNIRFAGGESKLEVRKRILDGLEYYATIPQHSNIGISSHGIAISQIMQHLGLSCPSVNNGAILHISRNSSNWQYHELIN